MVQDKALSCTRPRGNTQLQDLINARLIYGKFELRIKKAQIAAYDNYSI